jgi:hypothetical protein
LIDIPEVIAPPSPGGAFFAKHYVSVGDITLRLLPYIEADSMDILTWNWDTETTCGGCSEHIVVDSMNLQCDPKTDPAGLLYVRYFVVCPACEKKVDLPVDTKPHGGIIFCR